MKTLLPIAMVSLLLFGVGADAKGAILEWYPPPSPPYPAQGPLFYDAIFAHFTGYPTYAPYDAGYDVFAEFDLGDNFQPTVDIIDTRMYLSSVLHVAPGDANWDGKVDFADFQVLLDHWLQGEYNDSGSGVTWRQGDFTGDDFVDFGDFQKMLDNWNPAGSNLTASQAPEPATLTLLALGAMGLLRRNRRAYRVGRRA